MANGTGFQSYPAGPAPDPKMVGAMLQRKAAAYAAGADGYDDLGGDSTGMDEAAAPDALGPARMAMGMAAGVRQRGTPTATGGDDTGTPGLTTPAPPVARMASQSSSNPVTSAPLEAADDLYDPLTEHSSSATASALWDARARMTGGATGIGHVQNPSMGSPYQREQFRKMGLSPVEIDLLVHGGGGVKA